MAKEPKPSIAVIAAAIGGRKRRARHSKLYLWMREHFDELQAVQGAGRPDWITAAEEFARLGLTDKNEKPPSPHTARMTWTRVSREEAAERERALSDLPARKAASSRPARKRENRLEPPVTRPPKPSVDEPEEDPARPSFTFIKDRK
jgi:hypothetical protein